MTNPNSSTARPVRTLLAILAFTGLAAGCSSSPPLTHSGFLSDYEALKEINPQRMSYFSPDLGRYRSFLVDPVQIEARSKLSAPDTTEVASYFHAAIVRVLQEHGYTVAQEPGPGTARVRVALTNIHESTWWMKVHPASSLAGAGRGGATMEGEIVDSASGTQLAAVVQSAVGSQFTVLNLSTVSDIKSAIDEWAKQARARLDEIRAGSDPDAAGASPP